MKRNRWMKPMLVTLVSLLVISIAFYFYRPEREGFYRIVDYAYDIRDKRKLIGSADYVFIGEVLKKEKQSKNQYGDYFTLYKVKVKEEVKGKLPGEKITISQSIGYNNLWKYTEKTQGDDYLIEGDAYVFSVRFAKELDAYQIIADGYGNVHLKRGDASGIIDQFKDAKEDQITNPFQ